VDRAVDAGLIWRSDSKEPSTMQRKTAVAYASAKLFQSATLAAGSKKRAARTPPSEACDLEQERLPDGEERPLRPGAQGMSLPGETQQTERRAEEVACENTRGEVGLET
jgi:hypothetical protein